ncbi:MAG: hypothetical protein BGO98_08530 [Myxococcales bacterium 68-20]|nr:hypothetical protein [Myxococcales bacterium]OJY25040.1 MAG: hypothetical protein BGO98_08530 [Myxococcales bacterium 68-20]
MRASLLLACGALALSAAGAVACATSVNNGTEPLPDGGGGESTIPDSGTPAVDAADAGDEASVDGPPCSQAGWCVTALPNVDLMMKDIWPLPGRAFAVAESPTLGVKVLEWDEAEAHWQYIDDGTQNDSGLGRWVGRLWAPNENEIYYGVSPGYVYHGTRPAPGAAWSWKRYRLGSSSSADPNDGNPQYWQRDELARTPAFGVWGTSSGDVYAWFKDTIYHWTSVDGGAPEWAPEYVAADVDASSEQLFFLGAAGTTDDVWFAGARSRSRAGCALVVRKTHAGYQRIADGVLPGDYYAACAQRAGALLIGGTEGWLTDIEAVATNQFIALKGARDVVRISVEGDGYSIAVAPVPQTVSWKGLNSLSTAAGNLWLGGAGLVVRGTDVWDGGAYELSTISLSGGPLGRPVYQVRGVSKTNLWAIGVHYALHKTTP